MTNRRPDYNGEPPESIEPRPLGWRPDVPPATGIHQQIAAFDSAGDTLGAEIQVRLEAYDAAGETLPPDQADLASGSRRSDGLHPDSRLTGAIASLAASFRDTQEEGEISVAMSGAFKSRGVTIDQAEDLIVKLHWFLTEEGRRGVGQREGAAVKYQSIGGRNHTIEKHLFNRGFILLLNEALEGENKSFFTQDELVILTDIALRIRVCGSGCDLGGVLEASAMSDLEQGVVFSRLRDLTKAMPGTREVIERTVLIGMFQLIEARRKFEYRTLRRKVEVIRTLRTDLRTLLFHNQGKSTVPFVTDLGELDRKTKEMEGLRDYTPGQEEERVGIISRHEMWKKIEPLAELRLGLESINFEGLLLANEWTDDDIGRLGQAGTAEGLLLIAKRNQLGQLGSAFMGQRQAMKDALKIKQIVAARRATRKKR